MNEGLYNLNNEDGTASPKDDGTTGTTDPTRACGLADCCDRIDGQIAEGCTAEGGVKRPANPWLQEVRRHLTPPFVLREHHECGLGYRCAFRAAAMSRVACPTMTRRASPS